jgi:large subunit ribosomal protein L25
MAQSANLQVATRAGTGKGAARTLRREGKIPGVIYGHDRAAEAVVVETLALTKLLGGISASTTIVDDRLAGSSAYRYLHPCLANVL